MTDELDNNSKREDLEKIIQDVFQITNPSIQKNRQDEISNFIETAINGDTVKKHLAINATLEKDRMAILVYILTNARLIKVEIDATQGIKSSSFFLNTLIGVQRELIEEGRVRVEISFQNGSVGLRYSANSQEITDFFQKVESQKGIANG